MANIRACLGLIFGGLGTGRDSSFVSGFPVYSIDGRKIWGVFGCLGAGKEFIITGLLFPCYRSYPRLKKNKVSSLLYMKKKVIESGCLDVLVAGKEVISSRRVSCPMRCCENVIWNVF